MYGERQGIVFNKPTNKNMHIITKNATVQSQIASENLPYVVLLPLTNSLWTSDTKAVNS